MTDWTQYFARPRVRLPRRVLAFSIFDDPEEVEKQQAQKEEKPKKPEEAPPKKPEKPKAPPGTKGKWKQFLGLFYEGGKAKVPNPNPKTKKKYPEVMFSTAMKVQPFAEKVQKEFQTWLDQGEPKPEDAAKGKKPEVGDPVKDVGQLEPGMYLKNNKGIVIEITEIDDDGSVTFRRYDEDKGDFLEPVEFSAEWAWKGFPAHEFVVTEAPKVPEKKPEPEIKDPFKIMMEELEAKEEAEKAKAKGEKAKKGEKISDPGDVEIGHAVMWEQDGEKRMGTVDERGDGTFYVRSMDEKGNLGPYLVFDEGDIEELGVHRTDKHMLPKAKGKKAPPKPKEPDLPDAPKKPEVEKIAEPSDVKVGDHVEWDLQGKTYRGEVTKFEPDGRFRAKIYWPESSGSHGKSPSFDAEKIKARETRIIKPDAVEEYEKKYKEYTAKKAEAEAEYSQKVKAWQQEKEKIEGAYAQAVHPTKRDSFRNVQGASHWNPNSSIGRKADNLLPKYKEKYGAEIKKLGQMAMDRASGQGPSAAVFASSEWESLSPGEKALYHVATDHGLSEKIGGFFTDTILDDEEKTAWVESIKGWQGNSGSKSSHRLMGALEELGVKGGPKTWEATSPSVTQGRSQGRASRALKSAMAKAMAFSQALYDALGVDAVTLYRGTSNAAAVDADTGTEVSMPNARELTSFSIRPATAYEFNERAIKYRVPVRNLFISPVTLKYLGPHPPHSEAEYIVADLADFTGKVMPHSESQIDKYADALKIKVAAAPLVISEEREDLDWIQRSDQSKDDGKKRKKKKDEDSKKTAGLLRLAQADPAFRRLLVAELGRMRR